MREVRRFVRGLRDTGAVSLVRRMGERQMHQLRLPRLGDGVRREWQLLPKCGAEFDFGGGAGRRLTRNDFVAAWGGFSSFAVSCGLGPRGRRFFCRPASASW